MKKGLLIYKARGPHKNIGDYIQTVAAEQYTGPNVVYVERDRQLHSYSGEPLKMILNGWFMHHPENWPPSKDIVPLLTSFHINPAIGERLLSEEAIEFFKKNGPVGCRDKGTEMLLKSKGIDAYFSGCLTLTLGKTFRHNPKSKRVCFVDPYYEVPKTPGRILKYFLALISNPGTILKVSKKMYGAHSLRSIFRSASFYYDYSKVFENEVLANAEYIEHSILESSFENEEAKLACAKSLLTKYAESGLVVTSRIHAALPCIGIGTPLIFIVSDDLKPGGKGIQPNAKGRFDGLVDLFNVMEYSDCKLKPILGFELKGKIGFNHSIRNKQNHLKIAEELEKSCTSFINNVSYEAVAK